MTQDSQRCAICSAEFASTAELVRHEKERHTQQGISGINPSNEYPADERASVRPREGHEFTRRNAE